VKVVDSCGWIEYFTDGALAEAYSRAVKRNADLLVPTVTLFEVYKKIKRDRGEEMALIAVARMKQGRIAPLDEAVALHAADLGLRHALPMADSIVYATARLSGALLVTSDGHFRGLQGVSFIE
jgi:predicted nucleic acid-binding protein